MKIQAKINFGNESLESLINEIIQVKLKEVTHMLKNGAITRYNKDENYPSTNTDEKVDEIK